MVLDLRAVQQRPQPLVGRGEAVLAGRHRDPGHFTPAHEALTAADPGQRPRTGELAHQVTGVGNRDGADHEPIRLRKACTA